MRCNNYSKRFALLRNERGFTLLELLISLLIFAILSVIAYGGLRLVLEAKERVEEKAEQLAELQTFFAIISRDIEQTIDRGIRDFYGDEQPAMIGDRSTLEFTRTGWRNPAGFTRSHLQRVAYSLDGDQLVRHGWHVLDRAQDSVPIESVLLGNINELEIRFLDLDSQWRYQWPEVNFDEETEPGLPKAVEVAVDIESWGRISRLYRVVGAKPVQSQNNANNN